VADGLVAHSTSIDLIPQRHSASEIAAKGGENPVRRPSPNQVNARKGISARSFHEARWRAMEGRSAGIACRGDFFRRTAAARPSRGKKSPQVSARPHHEPARSPAPSGSWLEILLDMGVDADEITPSPSTLIRRSVCDGWAEIDRNWIALRARTGDPIFCSLRPKERAHPSACNRPAGRARCAWASMVSYATVHVPSARTVFYGGMVGTGALPTHLLHASRRLQNWSASSRPGTSRIAEIVERTQARLFAHGRALGEAADDVDDLKTLRRSTLLGNLFRHAHPRGRWALIQAVRSRRRVAQTEYMGRAWPAPRMSDASARSLRRDARSAPRRITAITRPKGCWRPIGRPSCLHEITAFCPA
jgi:hypothetical protein